MDFDFSLVLVVLVGCTGVVWLLDVALLAPRRGQAAARYREQITSKGQGQGQIDPQVEASMLREPAWIEYPKAFFPVLLVVLLLRSFLFEPFKIPSSSMVPTLEIGDYILVNKYAYGLRLPLIGTEIVPVGLPQRGDILVFRYPENPRINYIKRVVGIPGDLIRYEDQQLWVNGEKVPLKPEQRLPRFTIYTESLGGKEHLVQYENYRLPTGSGSWLVGDGEYFTLGDNRDNSKDSRFWGFVPENHIVGQAFAVWMHMPGWIPSFRNNRFLN
jgi:signal peptidase I